MQQEIREDPIINPREPSNELLRLIGAHRRVLVLLALGLLAFGYFAFTAFQASTSFYLSVDELVDRGPQVDERYIRVKGSLVEYSFSRDSKKSTQARFQLTDGGAVVDATYDGVLPDLFFNPHSEIVVGGQYGADGVFRVQRNSVLVKCPSKYEALDVDVPYEKVPSSQSA